MKPTNLRSLTLMTCFFFCFSCEGKPPKSPADKQLRIATTSAENQLKKQFNLKKHKSYGQGATTYDKGNQIETICDSFYHVGAVSLDDARIMLIQTTDRILKAVNQNEELRPFLAHYPVTIDQLSISVYFKSKEEQDIYDDTRVPVNEICKIYARKGELIYYTRLYRTYPVDPDSKLALVESYEEAKEKLNR